jgi:hypothetical protein
MIGCIDGSIAKDVTVIMDECARLFFFLEREAKRLSCHLSFFRWATLTYHPVTFPYFGFTSEKIQSLVLITILILVLWDMS